MRFPSACTLIVTCCAIVALIGHGLQFEHRHPGDGNEQRSVKTHTHEDVSPHAHQHASSESAPHTDTRDALAELGYAFHYREAGDDTGELLVLIAAAQRLPGIPRLLHIDEHRLRAGGAAMTLITSNLLPADMNMRLRDNQHAALRAGILAPHLYG